MERMPFTGRVPVPVLAALLAVILAVAAGPTLAAGGVQPSVNVSLSLTVPTFIEMVLNSSNISFPATPPGGVSPATGAFPLAVNITDNTNTPVNITLKGDGDFNRSGGNESFNMTNLTYSNVSAGGANKSVVSAYNLTNPFPDWVNRPVPGPGTNVTIPAYFYLRIPPGQEAGTYSTNVTIRASQA
ncbi:MAG: hypothetical protein QXT68_04515 [Halobacteria archaeon]